VERSTVIRAVRGFTDWVRNGEFNSPLVELQEIFTDEACEAAGMTLQEIHDLCPDAVGTAMLAVYEELTNAECEPDDKKALDVYLVEEGKRLPSHCRDYLLAVQAGVRSLFEVVEVEHGLAVTVEDILRDRERSRVYAPDLSKTAEAGDKFCARLVQLDGHLYFTDSLMEFDPKDGDAVVDTIGNLISEALKIERKLARKERRTARNIDQLRVSLAPEMCPRLTCAWLLTRVAEAQYEQDDEDLELRFYTLTFKIAPGYRDSVEARLDKHPEFTRDEPGAPTWTWEDPSEAEDEYTTVEIVGDAVVWETFSVGTPTEGRGKLMKILGPAVEPPLVVEQSAQEAMDTLSQRSLMEAKAHGVSEAEWRQEIARRSQEAYAGFLDEPNPYLNGKSPREAVKTKSGRRTTAEMLRLLESRGIGVGEVIDFTWMWKELGILDLREDPER
jgi:hypothetical protein